MRKFLLFITILFSFTLKLSAAHEISSQGYVVLLLGDDTLASESGWTNHADSSRLLNYGTSRSMSLVDDARPVANQKASFISAPGVTFMVDGFKPQLTYRMWIDFVRFSFDKNPGIYSSLSIFADGRQIDEIVWGDIDKNSLYEIELPLDLTYDGSVSITFREKANNYGYWGIWDIIIGTGDLPQGSFFEENMKEMTRFTEPEAPVSERDTAPKREEKEKTSSDSERASEAVRPEEKKSTPEKVTRKSAPQKKKKSTPRKKTTKKRQPRQVEPDVPVVDEPVEPIINDVNVNTPEMPDEPVTR